MEVKLPVWVEGTRRGVERVPATVIAPGRYQLVYTPGGADGLAGGDIIEFSEGFPGFNLVKRGGNFGIWLWSDGRLSADDPIVSDAQALAAALNGSVDGGTSRSIVITVPSATGFDNIVAAVNRWTRDHPGFVWEFTNAYAYAEDGSPTPLRWW
ncbi:MAG: DUF4265 domain-containing protein [Polyangiales bacterium]